jgi:hypothetical protein
LHEKSFISTGAAVVSLMEGNSRDNDGGKNLKWCHDSCLQTALFSIRNGRLRSRFHRRLFMSSGGRKENEYKDDRGEQRNPREDGKKDS